jgi:hypothetical protein
MSEDKVPEWVRLKRETEALWRGAWEAIGELWHRLNLVEERLDKIERTVERDTKPTRTVSGKRSGKL